MSCKSLSRAAVAAIALLASSALFAQAPPAIVIDFGGLQSVPLEMWGSLGAGLLIASAAYAYFRRRGVARFGRLSTWIVVVAAAAGTMVVASKVDLIDRAQAAILPTVVTLTSSPAIITVGGAQLFEVHNGTGAPVTIHAITLQNPLPGQHITEARGLNCEPGLNLPAGAICYIAVDEAEE